MTAQIETAGLGFVYPDGTRALEGVDLRIRSGELLAIIGQNGSGKSTLVRHFNGLLRATEGTVSIGGVPVARRHVAELARTVGVVFQNPDRQIFAGSVRREVEFGARNLGYGGADLARRVTDALGLVGLGDAVRHNPYDLGFSRRKLLRAGRIVLDGTPEEVFAESEWPVLASTFLEPTLAARVGAQRGLGSTPTEASLIAALQVRGGPG